MQYDISDYEEIQKILAQRKHERFMKFCWQNRTNEFLVGIHTHYICRIIDHAIDKFRKGQSSFYIVTVPFRHGKSDCISRYLPPHFLGEFPDCEVLLATYSLSLSYNFSKFCKNLINSDEYKILYPNIKLSRQATSVQQWNIDGHLGGFGASALGASLTGRGYHLGLLDDFCSSREAAESYVIREKMWEQFTNDFLTRRAPVSITIILATPWHVDDIIGRIKARIDKNSEKYDENFPQFKVVSFPAKNGDIDIVDKTSNGDIVHNHIQYEYLFPERFSKEWYEQQFASLGSYASSGLLQCNPQIRGGNLFEMSAIKIHKDDSDFPKTKYFRVWDYAHTAKQMQKDDPDWTSGTLLAFTKIEESWHIWIKDVVHFRGKAPERDNLVRSVAEADGMGVGIAVENSVDSKDAVSQLQTALRGRRNVIPLNINIDKIARAGYVEPIFEVGHVHIVRGDWNRAWLEEFTAFPSGKHDDQVDNVTAGYQLCCKPRGHFATV